MTTDDTEFESFLSSMPESYRARFDEPSIRLHAEIAARLAGEPIGVEIFSQQETETGICIVAADRPGLLSRITEALLNCELDVTNAAAYTRVLPGGKQALDVFWVSRLNGKACDEADIAHVRDVLSQLVDGDGTPRLPEVAPSPSRSDTRVRFIEDQQGALATLEIETDNRAGLLLSLARTLYAQHVQIVHSEIRTIEGRCHDRFQIAELDGSPVGMARRLEIQVAVLTAAEPARRLSTRPPDAG